MDKPSFVLPRPQTYNLSTLPAELIVYITDFLTSSSIACLGLTCHHLYSLTRERCRVDLNARPERFEFLNCIARDLPEYIPCHGWSNSKLYRWRHQGNSYFHCDHCFGNPQHRCKYLRRGSDCPDGVSGLPVLAMCVGDMHIVPEHGGWVTFGLRQLLLRHELLGKEYGVPLSTLNHQCFPPIADVQHTSLVRITSKIARNGNLMIRKSVFFGAKAFFNHEWENSGPICNHTMSETLAVVKWGLSYFKIKDIMRKKLAGESQDSQGFSNSMEKIQEFEALQKMCNYPDRKWHRCSLLLKCEYCATDTRFYICKIQDDKTGDDFLIRFEVYHDLGSLYQPMTIPQRQLIEVATHLPKIQAKYPSLIELHDRIRQNLEAQYRKQTPLNVRGTAIRAMEEAMKKNPETTLQTSLPMNSCFFTYWSGAGEHGFRRPSNGFITMLSTLEESGSTSSPAEKWSVWQQKRKFLPFERCE